jgi:hypothetical protein
VLSPPSAVQQAYPSIVACSDRAATLRYCCKDRELAWSPVATHEHISEGAYAGALGDTHTPHTYPREARTASAGPADRRRPRMELLRKR